MFTVLRSKLYVLDHESGFLKEFELGFNARWACFTPEGGIFCVGDGGRVAWLRGEELSVRTVGVKENLRGASFSKEGRLLAVGNRGLVLYGPGFERLEAETDANLRRVAWSPSTEEALVVGNGGAAFLFDAKTKSFARLEGAANNLRGVCWVEGEEPLVVGSAYSEMFVPTPNVYRVRGRTLVAVAELPRVDLLAAAWWAARKRFVAVGYDVVLHEPKIYLMGEEVEEAGWGGEGVYLSAVAFHPSEDLGVVATSHPASKSGKHSYAYLLKAGRAQRILEVVGYGFVCANWSPDGGRTLLLASQGAKTYNV